MLSVSSVFRNRGTAKKSIILISEMTTVISMRVNPLFFSGFIIMVLRQFGTKRMNNRHNVSFHRCCTKDGKVKEAKGRAWVMDKKTPAKLKVSFFSLFGFWLFAGHYWIIDLGPEYQYAVIGHSIPQSGSKQSV